MPNFSEIPWIAEHIELYRTDPARLEVEAEALKAKIESGELTMFQAAAEHSAAPDAKQNLGELGWIAQGKTKPQLDQVDAFRKKKANLEKKIERDAERTERCVSGLFDRCPGDAGADAECLGDVLVVTDREQSPAET